MSDEFLVWFDREYPMDETGSRTKYKETCVMDLMRSAFEARRTVSGHKAMTVKEISNELQKDNFTRAIAEYRGRNPAWFQCVEMGVRMAEKRLAATIPATDEIAIYQKALSSVSHSRTIYEAEAYLQKLLDTAILAANGEKKS